MRRDLHPRFSRRHHSLLLVVIRVLYFLRRGHDKALLLGIAAVGDLLATAVPLRRVRLQMPSTRMIIAGIFRYARTPPQIVSGSSQHALLSPEAVPDCATDT